MLSETEFMKRITKSTTFCSALRLTLLCNRHETPQFGR